MEDFVFVVLLFVCFNNLITVICAIHAVRNREACHGLRMKAEWPRDSAFMSSNLNFGF